MEKLTDSVSVICSVISARQSCSTVLNNLISSLPNSPGYAISTTTRTRIHLPSTWMHLPRTQKPSLMGFCSKIWN